MLTQETLQALWLTFKLATITTILLIVICTPIAWWLATSRHKLKPVIEAFIALPLVLPPTVIGFYLLIVYSPDNFFGASWLNLTGYQLAFSFSGLVIGSIFYSLPFVVQPLQTAFEKVGKNPVTLATMLGAPPKDRFFTIAIPLSVHGYLSAAVLGFAHTVGEFGVILMIGGSIPGETRVASITIYDFVETLQYGAAHSLSAILLAGSFLLLLLVYGSNHLKKYAISEASELT